MKKLVLLILIIILVLPVLAAPIDETTAKQLAQNFWKENNIMGVRGDKVFKKRMDDAKFVNVAPQCGYSEFFIFNNEDGKGFVIIAADDCVTPILGYSYDNNFAAKNLPPNLKDWLDGYSEQIRMAVEMRAMATDEIRADWECLRRGKNLPIKSETAVNPLLSTAWGQGDYYNAQCPSLLGTHTPTGCVATAMAQIMKYWNYPAHGYGFHSYQCWPYGTLLANFGGTNYQWNSMPNNVTSPNNAVATLMYHCGVSVEMDYGINGSSAYVISYDDFEGYHEFCAENALKSYFGYSSNNIQGLQRSHHESNWISLLKNELNNNRPILYRGGGPDGGGHAFVCDGYNNNNYFHFNWGWDGLGQGTNNNAYYSIDNLNPTVNQHTYNFSYDQQAIIGIQPDSNLQSYDLVLYDDVQMVGDVYGNYGFGQSISAYAEVLNDGNSTFSGYIAAAVFDNNGYFIDFLGGGYTSLEPNYWTSGTVEHEGGIPFLPSYEYLYHTIMFYSTNGENWTIVNSGNYSNDAVFQIFNNGEDIVTNSDFTISTGDNVLYNGQTATINIDIINEGLETYYGMVWTALINEDGQYEQVIDVFYIDDGLPVNGHYINGIDFTSTINVPEGQYYLGLIYSDSQSGAHYAGSIIYPCLKSVYVINSYTINTAANPSNGGVVTGSGNYLDGETCTLTATANNGYTFVNWTENGTQVSTNANYTFTVTGNRNLVANFQNYNSQGGGFSTGTNTIVSFSSGNLQYRASTNTWKFAEHQYDYIGNANSNISSSYSGWIDLFGWGTSGYNHGAVCYQPWSTSMTNSDYYAYGSSYYNLYDQTGQADWGYNVISNGGNEINQWRTLTNEEWLYIFNLRNASTVNGTPNARYAKALVNNIHGVILFPDNYSHPSNVMQPIGINETGNVGWNGNNYTTNDWNAMETNGAIFLPVTGYRDGTSVYDVGAYGNYWSSSSVYTINFHDTYISQGTSGRHHGVSVRLVQDYIEYTIYGSPLPQEGGTIAGNGIYASGSTCTLTATANENYIFLNWTENGTQVSTNANYTFTVTGNRNLVANFQAQPQQYTINVSASPSNGGNVTGGGTYQQGQTCTVSATADSGYTFINWTENGTQVSTNANYSFTVNNNRNLVAHFTTQNYVITATADPTAGGTVTGSGGYNYGESCTLTATANAGYTFINWTKNGAQVSTNPTYTFTVTETETYIAHFSIQNYTITTASSPSNGGTTSGGGTYNYGQTCTITASAASGYAFTNWTENGTQVSTNSNYSFTVTGNRNLVANFAQSTHTIQASAGANGIITPSGTITVAHGASQSFAMIPNEGYEVQDVYIDGNSVGPMASYIFTNVIADHYIHVTFVHTDGIGESNDISIDVYPNPTQGEVTLEGENLSHVRIVNAFGQTVYNAKLEGDRSRIDLSGFAKGIYMMHIEAQGGQAIRKIVVE